jgi:hypothetical protein
MTINYYISFDIETTGPIPHKHNLLAIGGVVMRQDGIAKSSFLVYIKPKNLGGDTISDDDFVWDIGTQEFWNSNPKAKEDIFQQIQLNGMTIKKAFEYLNEWLSDVYKKIASHAFDSDDTEYVFKTAVSNAVSNQNNSCEPAFQMAIPTADSVTSNFNTEQVNNFVVITDTGLFDLSFIDYWLTTFGYPNINKAFDGNYRPTLDITSYHRGVAGLNVADDGYWGAEEAACKKLGIQDLFLSNPYSNSNHNPLDDAKSIAWIHTKIVEAIRK